MMAHLANNILQMRRMTLALIVFIVNVFGMSAQADKAKELYNEKNYVGAANAYEQLLENAAKVNDVQAVANYNYNLGNCYYRTQNFGKAVLHYQRALRINPADDDARFNLQLTQSKLTDQFSAPSEMFFVSWYRNLRNSISATAWGWTANGCMLLAFALFILFKLSNKALIRKSSVIATSLCTICALFCWTTAYIQNNYSFSKEQIVVMKTVNAYNSPSETAKITKQLHEGTLLNVQESQPNGWILAEMPDGIICWVKKSNALVNC